MKILPLSLPNNDRLGAMDTSRATGRSLSRVGKVIVILKSIVSIVMRRSQ
ncbi:MAG: hypothetical protein ACK5WL_01420 [Pseudanabaena sp.]